MAKNTRVYSYATASTPTEGITAELVYAGKGTMWDYQELDVTGKIVLIDIDQRADWWITYPMLEAEHQGAAAVLAANVGGHCPNCRRCPQQPGHLRPCQYPHPVH